MEYKDIAKVNEEMPKIDIKGKDYIDVASRVQAFRKLFPNGAIHNDIVSLENGIVVMSSTILDENGHELAKDFAYEKENSSFINKTSFIENCSTSATGRALGLLGIGSTQSIASADEVQNAILNQNNLITNVMIQALEKSIKNNNISQDQVDLILEKYDYKTIDEIKKDDYKPIVDELKSIVGVKN
jgi:hypothetical protein